MLHAVIIFKKMLRKPIWFNYNCTIAIKIISNKQYLCITYYNVVTHTDRLFVLQLTYCVTYSTAVCGKQWWWEAFQTLHSNLVLYVPVHDSNFISSNQLLMHWEVDAFGTQFHFLHISALPLCHYVGPFESSTGVNTKTPWWWHPIVSKHLGRKLCIECV